MKIALIVEGRTEHVFLPYLRTFLSTRLQNSMPAIRTHRYDGPIPEGDALKRKVENLLSGPAAVDHVIALTDVYTGTDKFKDSLDAREKMRKWVGENPHFHPHAAQHDFEAWLLPYWPTIQRLAGSNRKAPAGQPESVNHQKSPAYHLAEVFRTGDHGRAYVKTRDAARILRENDLSIAVTACPQLKELVNTIISINGGQIIS
jgi:hypothetical protein